MRESYAAIYAHPQEEHAWFAHSTDCIRRAVESVLEAHATPLTVLDAGCGRLRYRTSKHTFVRMDLVYEAVRGETGGSVGDVQALPFRDGAFDLVVCVGSVLNYLDLETAAAELARVTRPDGALLVEYERSRSWTTLGTRAFGRPSTYSPRISTAGLHALRLYSDVHLQQALAGAGVTTTGRHTFHGATAFLYLFTRSLRVAALAAGLDRLLAPIFGRLGANAIVEGVKHDRATGG